MNRRRVLKLGAAAAAGTGLALGAAPAGAAAPVVTRPEVRTLTTQQWQDFVAAVHQLHSGDDPYTAMVGTHYNHQSAGHGVPAFLPWHRVDLSRLAKRLREIDPSVVLPYWDWSRDSQAPERSPVLGPSYFGGVGRQPDGAVVDGAFPNWQCTIPNRHLLRRTTGPRIASFHSPESLERILTNSNSYDYLRRHLEGAPHGAVHTHIGGNNGDMSFMYAPNDPIFWVAECFIDLLWAEWQQRNPTLARTYDGGGAKPSNVLRPFDVTVADTFDTRALGYIYPRWSARRPA
ncbi:tyrosinase family protein [Embleya sp. NPDC050493]|uniref:tyrosinase family protein n=1 Tax=Embleya sp. NPDC050493 TaxID=3363989 RepID=UPI0037A877CD